jgi:hypothetical protein
MTENFVLFYGQIDSSSFLCAYLSVKYSSKHDLLQYISVTIPELSFEFMYLCMFLA